MGEGWAEQIAADPFELLTVATVDRRRGVEMHPERCHRQRRPGRGLLRRDQMWAREPELHAGLRGPGGHPLQGKRANTTSSSAKPAAWIP